MLKAFIALLKSDLTQHARRVGEWILPLLFMVMVVSLYPLGLGPAKPLLTEIAPAIIWTALILAILLSAENLFQTDYEDGMLEQLVLSPYPLPILILAKVVAHWAARALPLILIVPIIGMSFELNSESIVAGVLALILGTPTLCLVAAMGASLTLGVHRGGLLLAILLLPFMIPILIFGISGMQKASMALPYGAELKLLGALLLFTLSFAPLAISAMIKVSVE
jgi:heme exporter protein B